MCVTCWRPRLIIPVKMAVAVLCVRWCELSVSVQTATRVANNTFMSPFFSSSFRRPPSISTRNLVMSSLSKNWRKPSLFSKHSESLLCWRTRTYPTVTKATDLLVGQRGLSTSYQGGQGSRHANKRTVMYMVALAVGVVGLSYAAVPLYRIFCQVCVCVCVRQ